MRFTITILGLCLLAGLAYGQLIIDEDDPEGKKLIDMMMKAINEQEKTPYTFKNVVYSIPHTIGTNVTIEVLLKVANGQGTIYSCLVELIGLGNDHYKTGPIVCHQ